MLVESIAIALGIALGGTVAMGIRRTMELGRITPPA